MGFTFGSRVFNNCYSGAVPVLTRSRMVKQQDRDNDKKRDHFYLCLNNDFTFFFKNKGPAASVVETVNHPGMIKWSIILFFENKKKDHLNSGGIEGGGLGGANHSYITYFSLKFAKFACVWSKFSLPLWQYCGSTLTIHVDIIRLCGVIPKSNTIDTGKRGKLSAMIVYAQ